MPSALWCRGSGSVRGIGKPDQAHREHENGSSQGLTRPQCRRTEITGFLAGTIRVSCFPGVAQ